MRKAMRNASTASPVPNRYATASSLAIAVALTTTERPPTVSAAARIRRLTDPSNQPASRRRRATTAVITRRRGPGPCSSLRLEPRLEHQHVPKRVVPVHHAALVLRPGLRDRSRIEMALPGHPRRLEERGGPLLKRPSQPVLD